jgi:hypothetical protein
MNNTTLYSGIALFSTCLHRETVALAAIRSSRAFFAPMRSGLSPFATCESKDPLITSNTAKPLAIADGSGRPSTSWLLLVRPIHELFATPV